MQGYDLAKRALDLVIASLALALLSPLLVLIAAAICCTSTGPVLFRQQRVGRGGALFRLYKFRSMHTTLPGASLTAAGDPRVTSVGRWLRLWKLDELPQFLNVLKGEMSLVGPRPEVPRFVERYTTEQQQVLTVRPGITGPAQIRFRDEERILAAVPDPETHYVNALLPAKLALDLEYVRDCSIRQDLALLARTLSAVTRLSARPSRARAGARSASKGDRGRVSARRVRFSPRGRRA